MTRLFNKPIRPAGLAPGTLFHHHEKHEQGPIRISVIEYSENDFSCRDDVSLDVCLEHLDTPSMTWIQVSGVSDPETIATIGKNFNFHSLVLEDILTRGQRSKLDLYEEQIFIVVRLLGYIEATDRLKDEQVSIIFGKNYLICFSESNQDIFLPIRERLRQGSNRIRKQGSDYLAYAILDLIVDHYFIVLEKVDTRLDLLEAELLHASKSDILLRIQHFKSNMIILRKAIWPIRDVINRFMKIEEPAVSPMTQLYLRDIYDHTVQTIDIIEGFRDIVSGMMDIYLSNINVRTNEIMRVLTIVSTLFVPLTFISSLYGMNFEFMPELQYRWGYPLVLTLMMSVASGMLLFFYRKKWI